MRFVTPMLVAVVLACPALAAQIPPRRTVAVASAAARILVTVPTAEGGLPAAMGTDLAAAFRRHLSRVVGGRYQLVAAETLNGVLAASGYEADAPLGAAAARAVGAQLKATLVLYSAITMVGPGQLAVTAALTPPGQPGEPVRVLQEPGTDVDALARAVVSALEGELR